MNANKAWAAYGRLADGSFVVEDGGFSFWGTQAQAQVEADTLAAKHNEANPDNPVVRAWPQQVIGNALPAPLEPAEEEARP